MVRGHALGYGAAVGIAIGFVAACGTSDNGNRGFDDGTGGGGGGSPAAGGATASGGAGAGAGAPGTGGATATGGATGTGGGPGTGGTGGTPPTADCSAITAGGWQVCASGPGRCEAVFEDSAGCQAVCAAAGMSCAQVFEDVDTMCQADTSRPELACNPESGHSSDFCVCVTDTTCVPDCSGKVCGPDGCGAQCGTCPGTEQCLAGTCTSGPAEDCSQYPFRSDTLLSELVGFGRFTTGGDPGNVYRVTTTANSGSGSLREGLESSASQWIVFDIGVGVQAEIDLGSTPIRALSNKTVDGRGRNILVNGAIEIRDERNIIISDVRLTNTNAPRCTQEGDVLLVRGQGANQPEDFTARDVWVHHVELFNGGDGLFDVRGGSRITVSWTHFHTHSKGLLLSQQSAGAIEGREMELTFHHNFFDRITRRGPRLTWGRAHYFNNYQFEWYEYGAASVDEGQLASENNIYQARPGAICIPGCPDPNPCGDNDITVSKIAVSNDWSASTLGFVSSTGDLLLEDAVVGVNEPARVFSPAAAYAYAAEPASVELANRTRSLSGPRTTYCQ